jgi:anti-anti-sigma regulatory factor
MGPRAPEPTPLFVDADDLVADMTSVDALARLVLIARRHGCSPVIRGVSPELEELIELVGLGEVLAPRQVRSGSSAPRC